ncbi:MAG: FHA domain-containing protein [Candidatus Aminicenantes bacterium]|nr:FHA domain-containing protein [Candidatus Aminicenantes bacterium]
MPLLRIVSREGPSKNFNLVQKIITIGRGKDNDIVLSDQRASRQHAQIKKENNQYVINDLGSVNGILLNETKTNSASLKHNDQIKIGNSILIFLEKEEKTQTIQRNIVVSQESDYEDWAQKTISVSPDDSCLADFEPLPALRKDKKEKKRKFQLSRKQEDPESFAKLESLERANKALYVLYEISKQLNSMKSFDEILTEMMDLLFKVIDADYGFLILTDHQKEEDYSPLIIKYRDETKKGKKEIKASRSIIKRVIEDKVALLTSNAQEDSRLGATESLVSQNIRSAMCVPLWQKDEIIGIIQLDSTRYNNQFTEDELELLKTIGCQMAMILEQASLNDKLREEEQMRNKLERFHSPQVIEMILNSNQETKENIMEAKEMVATVLFTDIVGFTPLSEKMEPKDINMLLNRHFSKMTDIIFEQDGTLDKYIGDSLMAVFGAPFGQANDAERAVTAALKMREVIEEEKKMVGHEDELNIRIGINTGKITAGNIGSPKRMDYTVLGDAVNVASRLESIAEPNQILIGEETYNLIKNKIKTREIGLKKLKGKSQDLRVYEVLG